MKYRFKISDFMILVAAGLLVSCSELREDLPTLAASEIQIHTAGWTDTASFDFHGIAIQKNNWDIRNCRNCHGSDYKGGSSGKSCYDCHTNPAGPENCSTCHGFPPPPSTEGYPSGKESHQVHLFGKGTYSSTATSCQMCHTLPTSVYAEGHLDPGENGGVVITDPLATLKSGGLAPVPVYNPNTAGCSNTFCHGTWRLRKSGLASDSVYTDSVMAGAGYSPKWNGGTIEIVCGSCHSIPPAGHKVYQQLVCSTCHEDVLTSAGRKKHINGKIDLNGIATRDFRQ
jgi:predicted CxxxxCH...CXXCH cytochrome family protein